MLLFLFLLFASNEFCQAARASLQGAFTKAQWPLGIFARDLGRDVCRFQGSNFPSACLCDLSSTIHYLFAWLYRWRDKLRKAGSCPCCPFSRALLDLVLELRSPLRSFLPQELLVLYGCIRDREARQRIFFKGKPWGLLHKQSEKKEGLQEILEQMGK